MDESLIIWTTSGATMKFEKVTHLRIEEGSLRFAYFGISTKTSRTAVFNMDHIMGWAISVQP